MARYSAAAPHINFPLSWVVKDGDKTIIDEISERYAKQLATFLNGPCPYCNEPEALTYERGYNGAFWDPPEPEGIVCEFCGDWIDMPDEDRDTPSPGEPTVPIP